MLPSFVCIGGQKTGTTWLYRNLINHPGVFLPAIKELNFFYRNEPQSWYEAQFSSATPWQARGDISPNYMPLPGVAERMAKLLPEVRVFCILREPVSRARSQYEMATKLGNIPADTPFIQAFRSNLQYIRDRGCYAELIGRFTPYYPIGNNLLILIYDDLLDDPTGFFSTVCRHIGADPAFSLPGLDKRVEPSGVRFRLAPEDEAEVRAYYSSHNASLEGLLGRSLGSWQR